MNLNKFNEGKLRQVRCLAFNRSVWGSVCLRAIRAGKYQQSVSILMLGVERVFQNDY